ASAALTLLFPLAHVTDLFIQPDRLHLSAMLENLLLLSGEAMKVNSNGAVALSALMMVNWHCWFSRSKAVSLFAPRHVQRASEWLPGTA
ncbi:hypothetical protein, partial [Aeromonas caviae]|uniref:hypothetical protein n=1 Tax=Aeromonas caviae TaxID=648 RepID=UPI00385C712C